MNINWIGYMVILLLLVGCKNEEKLLVSPLTEEEMSMILTDVHMAESRLQSVNIKDRDSIAALFYTQIFKLHEIEENDFYQSFESYTQRPQDMIKLYDKVLEEISEQSKEKYKPSGEVENNL